MSGILKKGGAVLVLEENKIMKLCYDVAFKSIFINCPSVLYQMISDITAITTEELNSAINAAKAGVKIVMIIRGACILPKMKNIKIYSIVGHYLEHSRVYVFGIGKSAQIMLGSADLMHRNLSLRNELLINITNPEIRERLMKHLAWYQQDNTHRREILDKYESTLLEAAEETYA